MGIGLEDRLRRRDTDARKPTRLLQRCKQEAPGEGGGGEERDDEDRSDLWGSQQQKNQKDLVTGLNEE